MNGDMLSSRGVCASTVKMSYEESGATLNVNNGSLYTLENTKECTANVLEFGRSAFCVVELVYNSYVDSEESTLQQRT